MPFLLCRGEGVRAFRYRFADDAGVTLCNTTEGGEPAEGLPCGGMRLSHERHRHLMQRGRIVQIPDAIYEKHRRRHGRGREGSRCEA